MSPITPIYNSLRPKRACVSLTKRLRLPTPNGVFPSPLPVPMPHAQGATSMRSSSMPNLRSMAPLPTGRCAQQELLNAQWWWSPRAASVAAFQVLAASGRLTAKSLGLKVTIYDPLAHYDDNAARSSAFKIDIFSKCHAEC